MSFVPIIPDSAPFSPAQRAWLNGYLAGLFSRAPGAAAAPRAAAAKQPPLQPLTILFGSQTGTSESLAKRAAREAGRRGFAATVLDMAQAVAPRLATEKNLLVITSTHGEGDPPDNARALHAALGAESAPRLDGVRFSVCALGDTNYVHFCQCGRDFDARLERLGATRAAPRADCDLDYEPPFAAWLEAALHALSGSPAASAEPAPPAPPPARSTEASPGFSRQNPLTAPVLVVRRLNEPASAKEVNHVELSLEDSGLTYEAGDALGVWPHNCPELVEEVLAALGCDGEEAVATPSGEFPLRVALLQHYELGRPTAELLALLAAVPAGAIGETTPAALEAPLDVLDALRASAAPRPAPAGFVARLRRLQPRLYSIASSQAAHPDAVHLTVGAVRYAAGGRARKGVCSTYLAERALAASTARIFVQTNRNFRPPADGDTPMIMIGPGTGIAPFRAFLQHRRATAARGRNWLFFGDQHEATDFLYREEILGAHRDGLLTRLDLAWSRDGDRKVYVQHRMREQERELFAWLEAGAHLYVCGDASRMAKDVDAALRASIASAGGRSPAQADDYVAALQAAKRYARDVY